MANFRIIPYNHHDDATLSSSIVPSADFAVTNTQNHIRGQVFKSAGTTAQSISGTLAAARSATFFGIFHHELWGSDIEIELFSDAAWTTSVYSSGPLPAENVTPSDPYDWGLGTNDPLYRTFPYYLWFPEETFQSYRIYFSGTPTIGYFQASRIWLGKHFETFINPAWGASIGYGTDTQRSRSRGGSLRTNLGASWKTMSFDFEWIPEADRAAWMDVMQYCGTSRDIVAALFPDDGTRLERDNIINAKFTSIDPIARSNYAYLSKKVQLEEC